jgi:hypothetical protein
VSEHKAPLAKRQALGLVGVTQRQRAGRALTRRMKEVKRLTLLAQRQGPFGTPLNAPPAVPDNVRQYVRALGALAGRRTAK